MALVVCNVRASENERLLADVIDDAVDSFICDLDDAAAAGDVTGRSRDVNTGVITCTGDDRRLLLLLSLLLADLVGCVVSAPEIELLVADVTDDVNNDDRIRDAVDPFMCDLDDAVAAEMTAGDVASRTRDVTAGVDRLTGDVITADDFRLLLLLLLTFRPVDSAYETELLLADVTGDVNNDDLIDDAIDLDHAVAAELISGDVTSGSRDVTTVADMSAVVSAANVDDVVMVTSLLVCRVVSSTDTGDVMTADVLRPLLLLLLLAFSVTSVLVDSLK